MRTMQSCGVVAVEDGLMVVLSPELQFSERDQGMVRVDLEELIQARMIGLGYTVSPRRAGREEVSLTRALRDQALLLAYDQECG